MKYTVVMPYAWQPYKDACETSWRFDPDSLMLLDNTVINVGIQRAYNLGIDKMRVDDSDWLIHLSAALRFGEPGGLDFIDQLKQHSDHLVVEASGVFGWHLIAFSRETVETVGRWDPNFAPYCYDDLDYSVRFQNAFNEDFRKGLGRRWTKVPVDVQDMGMAHGIKIAGIKASADANIFYFTQKWGRHPDHYQESAYRWPWNDPANSVKYWPPYTNVDGVTEYWDRSVYR